jgi:hypothetical protein
MQTRDAEAALFALSSASLYPRAPDVANQQLAAHSVAEQRAAALSTLDAIERRPYGIREADPRDIDALLALEESWDAALRADRAKISERLRRGRALVAVVEGEAAAVLYTQRVRSSAALLASSFAEQHSAETVRGVVGAPGAVQLVAVASAARHQALALGAALRDFALLLAEASADTTEVLRACCCIRRCC